MGVSDPDGKLEDLVLGQRHVKPIQVEEGAEQDDRCTFVAIAKGVVRCDAPKQSRRLSDNVGALVSRGVLRRAKADSSRPRSSTADLASSTETSTASA